MNIKPIKKISPQKIKDAKLCQNTYYKIYNEDLEDSNFSNPFKTNL